MKKILSILTVVFTLSLSTVAMYAEAAKRMGSGKSMGTQKQVTQNKTPTAPAAAAPTTAGAAGAAAAPSRSWMGPVAGLAAGLGLAALASHLGFGAEMASMLMMGLLVVAVVMVIGFVMRSRAASQSSMDRAPNGLQYARATPMASPQEGQAYKVAMPPRTGSVIGSAIGGEQLNQNRIPAGFDAAGFERNAKVNFIRLQAANDAGDLDDIREFTTPEMFAELKMEMTERGLSMQKNDVVSINAQVTEVDEDADRYLVSVRFTGVVREQSDMIDESFDEIWHLIKSRQGGGWVLAGIQQTS